MSKLLTEKHNPVHDTTIFFCFRSGFREIFSVSALVFGFDIVSFDIESFDIELFDMESFDKETWRLYCYVR